MPRFDKTSEDTLFDVKRRLSPKLMPLEGVSGVGIAGGKLAIYLVSGKVEKELRKIKELIETEAPGTPVEFVTTGSFRAH